MTVKYTKDHEWIRLDGDVATIGITNYAQEQLGDVVFVEVPEAGARSSKATRPWPTTRRWSIPIPKGPAGSSR